jgi:hypothetical protein
MKHALPFIACIAACSFLNAQVPVISNINPLKGDPGKQVTITGNNFNTTAANNIVYFGATRGFVLSSTATNINVLVPVGATYGPVSVLNTGVGLMAFSTKYFTPTFTPKKGGLASGDFDSRMEYAVATKPTALAIGDFLYDGRPDIVVTTDVSNVISQSPYCGLLFRNNAVTGAIDSLSLDSKSPFITGLRPQSVVVGDVDLNGSLDMVTADYQSNDISCFPSSKILASGFGPIDVAVADIDGDGKPDIVSANALSFGISVFRNANIYIGTSAFDAKVDFVTGFQPMAIAVGDLDNDGKPDIVIANSNNDTTLDIAVLKNTSTTGAIDNTSFAPVVYFTAGKQASEVALGDIDGDGKPDIIVANQKSKSISILRNVTTNGVINAGSFSAAVNFPAGTKPKSIALGDLNGDGRVDIVVANQKSNNVSVYRNTSASGSITLAAPFTLGSGNTVYGVAVCDFDGDGRPDIETVNYNTNTIAIIKNEIANKNLSGFYETMEDRALNYMQANRKPNPLQAYLYPNPATDYAILSLGAHTNELIVTINNVSGNKVWEGRQIKESVIQVPVGNWSPGVYFVTIQEGISQVQMKLLKQ